MSDHTGEDQLSTSFCFNVYTLQRAFGRFFQSAFGETGFTYPKFVILKVLDEAGPLTVTELSQRAGVEANTLSPLLKKMAGFGLISRTRAEEDERRVVLALEDKGRLVLARAQAVVMDGFAELGLDAAQVDGAIAFLRATRDKVESADPPRLNLEDIL